MVLSLPLPHLPMLSECSPPFFFFSIQICLFLLFWIWVLEVLFVCLPSKQAFPELTNGGKDWKLESKSLFYSEGLRQRCLTETHNKEKDNLLDELWIKSLLWIVISVLLNLTNFLGAFRSYFCSLTLPILYSYSIRIRIHIYCILGRSTCIIHLHGRLCWLLKFCALVKKNWAVYF